MSEQIRVGDLPARVFHWPLAGSFTVALPGRRIQPDLLSESECPTHRPGVVSVARGEPPHHLVRWSLIRRYMRHSPVGVRTCSYFVLRSAGTEVL